MNHALPMETADMLATKSGTESIISNFKIEAEAARCLQKCMCMTAQSLHETSDDADANVAKPLHLLNTPTNDQNKLHLPEKRRHQSPGVRRSRPCSCGLLCQSPAS